MNDRRRGLGRGLGALIPVVPPHQESIARDATARPVDVLIPERSDEPTADAGRDEATAGGYFSEIPLSNVRPNSRQPRQVFDEDDLAELVHSLREIGLLQPVVVRPLGDEQYELVMGERRWRAAQQAGFTHLPAIVRQTEDQSMLRDALLENLHRSPLNPLEEAAAYDQMLNDFACTFEELAQRIGRSRPQISNTLRLLKLPPTVQRKVAAGVLSAGLARALLSVTDEVQQSEIAERIVAEGLSVRAVEELASLAHDTTGDTPKATKTHRPVSPRLIDIADRLSSRLETRVKVNLGRHKGKVAIEFATLDDLERILGILDPDLVIPKHRHDSSTTVIDDAASEESAATATTGEVIDLRDPTVKDHAQSQS